ncbi:hypothetical protein C1Y40_04537 [Mycobacterium talmoniae]|uniref:Uncharacterized protein n=1 Tax=Mycobacterium talmoniae TaxID=1858794 RepID=A0A2S8BF83_9MYCO|nr:hypothetical protein C1Y40_04537 [Mycobacterium talmoniae]
MENTAWFADFIRESRARRGWSQQQVDDAGGPYRQLQASIENQDRDDIPDGALLMFERAYGWPPGYATALAELGEYHQHGEINESLRGDERDAAALTDPYSDEAPQKVWKTFSGLYQKPDPDVSGNFSALFQAPYIGFDATSGEPVYLEGPLLTNVPFQYLHPMILPRHGAAVIDTNVLDSSSTGALTNYYIPGVLRESVAQEPMPVYRVATTDPANRGTAITVDPLSGITRLSEAKNLVAALRDVYPHVATSTVRAAFTFLVIAAFGHELTADSHNDLRRCEDPLVTITELKRCTAGTADGQFTEKFAQFWQNFYDPAKAGPELAQPDYRACDLLAGLLAARDELLEVQIASTPFYKVVPTLRPDTIMSHTAAPSLVFYDSCVVPELPVALSHAWPPGPLTFYQTELGPPPRPALWRHYSMQSSVGITTADDRDVIAQHTPLRLGTLTNYVGRQAIYCESGRARRVWIPRR